MQDENQQQEQQETEAQAEEQAQAPAEEEQVEEPAAEAGEEQAAEAAGEAATEEPGVEAEAEAAPAEDAPSAGEPEVLTPKQRRKLSRSRTGGPPGPQRSPADRARERAEARSGKAAERARWRARRREKKKGADSASGIGGEARDGVVLERAKEASEPGKRKVRQGVVMSHKGDKTITVRIDRVGRHRVYGRVVRSTGTLHVHDERNEAAEGDLVRVIECRPLSRTKRWRLVEVVQKAR